MKRGDEERHDHWNPGYVWFLEKNLQSGGLLSINSELTKVMLHVEDIKPKTSYEYLKISTYFKIFLKYFEIFQFQNISKYIITRKI